MHDLLKQIAFEIDWWLLLRENLRWDQNLRTTKDPVKKIFSPRIEHKCTASILWCLTMRCNDPTLWEFEYCLETNESHNWCQKKALHIATTTTTTIPMVNDDTNFSLTRGPPWK